MERILNLNDEYYMKRALSLARRGLGRTNPNPIVGAVIVRNDEIIGEGYHRYYGGSHAEINTIRNAKGEIKGATLYVTLEPCCHYGKTPPCVDAIIEGGVGRVVIGTMDSNPMVKGKSIGILKQRGVEITVGVLEEECYRLNEAYFKHMGTGIPLVTLKFAQTLDGRIATVTGNSRWISSEPSRKLAHKLRSLYDGILVGVGTVLADDSQLTVRLVKGRNPTRIVLDSELRIPVSSKVLRDQEVSHTIVATTPRAEKEKFRQLSAMGIEVLVVQADEEGRVDLKVLLGMLGERGISSLLVEGGTTVTTALLQQGLVDKLVVFIAPKILGKGIEAIGDLGIKDIDQALKLSRVRSYRRGEDMVVEARLDNTETRKT